MSDFLLTGSRVIVVNLGADRAKKSKLWLRQCQYLLTCEKRRRMRSSSSWASIIMTRRKSSKKVRFSSEPRIERPVWNNAKKRNHRKSLNYHFYRRISSTEKMFQASLGRGRRNRLVGSAIERGNETLTKASSSSAPRRYHKGFLLDRISKPATAAGWSQEGEKETVQL